MPLIIPRLFLFLCVLCLGLAGTSRAERKSAAPIVGAAPPQPVEMNLKVRREGKTEIPLRIYGKTNEALKYLIRVAPVNGKVSDPQFKEREISTVIYEPPADLGITTDKFAYAVQSAAGVSAAVEVQITIIDQPPQLGIQDRFDFGTIRAGATNYRMLEISNKGGLIASGEVIVDAPWKIEGKTAYRLRADEIAVFKVIFAPEAGGKFEGVARYTSDPQHSTTLEGVAEAAIAANPPQWVLQQTPGETARTGTFELLNQLDEPRTVQLKADPRLKVPAQLTIAPHAAVNVTVEAASASVEGFEAAIRLEAPDFSIALPVRVPTLAAIMRTTPQAVNFGRLAMGAKPNQNFVVENVGGTSGRLTWEINPPFHTPETSATLQAGEKKEFVLELETKSPGRYRTWLKFRAGAQTFDMLVEAEIAAAGNAVHRTAAGASGSPGNPGDTTSADPGVSSEASETPPPPAPVPLPDWVADPRLPRGVRVSQVTATSAVIEWPAALSPATRFRVDMRQIKIGADHRMEISWVQPTGIPIERQGANFVATLTDMPPGQPWTVRILPLQASGEAGAPLFTVEFQTLGTGAIGSRLAHPSLLQLLVVALILLLGWQAWRRWGRREQA
ncbi:MAG TPA: fibronectin type III domain-containing protein [Chthoniobacter sp.]|nr:fibronectin type III domain-containing protein [Chthoniobacter sp.]